MSAGLTPNFPVSGTCFRLGHKKELCLSKQLQFQEIVSFPGVFNVKSFTQIVFSLAIVFSLSPGITISLTYIRITVVREFFRLTNRDA